MTVMVTSCSEWLDVVPEQDVDGEEQIADAQGFQEILDGAYIGIAKEELYGKEMSYGLIESVAINHYVRSGNDPLNEWKYGAAIGRIDNIFRKSYEVISNLNYILDNIDAKKEVFNEEHFLYVKSEAKAMRAFLHFDLLRAFAKNYADAPNELAIPYVDRFEKVIFPHLSADIVASKILEDLTFAEENLEAVDIIVGKTSTEMTDKVLNARRYRFNYFAVLALKARVYQYIGEYELASTYAQKVIDEFGFKWVSRYSVRNDRTFSTEAIFALNVYNLGNQYVNDFGDTPLYIAGYHRYEYAATKLFEIGTPSVGSSDSRFQYCFVKDKYGYNNISSKYELITQSSTPLIPLIKISEMYLIVAENSIDRDFDMALNYVNEVRKNKGPRSLSIPETEEGKLELMSEIMKEFRKETYLEGQMFFMMKRLGVTEFVGLNSAPFYTIQSDNYIFPMPLDEIQYGFGSRN